MRAPNSLKSAEDVGSSRSSFQFPASGCNLVPSVLFAPSREHTRRDFSSNIVFINSVKLRNNLPPATGGKTTCKKKDMKEFQSRICAVRAQIKHFAHDNTSGLIHIGLYG